MEANTLVKRTLSLMRDHAVAVFKNTALWLLVALDVVALLAQYGPLLCGQGPILNIPSLVYWILPLAGFYWANFQVYRDLRERVIDGADARVRARDGETLNELKAIMTGSGSSWYLREHDFANTFDVVWFSNLHMLVERCKGSELEFLDHDLERLRLDLLAKVEEFLLLLGKETFPLPVPGGRLLNSVPKEWRRKQPERYTSVVQGLNTKAQAVIDLYDDLIRLGKRRV